MRLSRVLVTRHHGARVHAEPPLHTAIDFVRWHGLGVCSALFGLEELRDGASHWRELGGRHCLRCGILNEKERAWLS
jgi:hypothetical protein